MLARSTAERRLARATARILDSLALAERIVGKDDVPLASEVGEQLLVTRPRFAVYRMAERPKNRGAASRSRWNVEIRRDVKAGTAFERHLLNAIARALDSSNHARVERRAIEWTSEHLP